MMTTSKQSRRSVWCEIAKWAIINAVALATPWIGYHIIAPLIWWAMH